MLKTIKKWIIQKIWIIIRIEQKIDKLFLTLGRIELRQLELLKETNIDNWEFQITSQWGEDGIIQYLIKYIEIPNKTFIEFGVESYKECNTRFLLQNNNWNGLIIDGSEKLINEIKAENIHWKYDLKAVTNFITKENIDNIFIENNIKGDIGLLSIDIDGNDYWVWEKISVIKPRIIIAEYNSLFGNKASVSIPYNKDFVRGVNMPVSYYGASITALTYLANSKGYSLVYGNKAGNNVFYVRKDLLNEHVKEIQIEQAYVKAVFKESRDKNGKMSFLNFEDNFLSMQNYNVIDVKSGNEVQLKNI
jgi:hypothetical protein